MREVLRSSVNAWECDHMGHMNVRHYVARANDGLSVFLLQLGAAQRGWMQQDCVVRARDQHIRFNRELRPGAAFSLHAGAVSNNPALIAYQEMRTLQGEISATMVTELSMLDLSSGAGAPWPAKLLAALEHERCVIPPYAAVRGVAQQPTRCRISRDEALQLGMLPGFLGPVLAEDCDAHGVMREAAVMARISDGISHFFGSLYSGGERPAGIGGAALEYRFVFHAWPRLNDAIEVRSALTALGGKTLQITHCVFELASGDCVASAQAIVVWFDLHARRAMELPQEIRDDLRTKVIAGVSL